MMQESGKRVLIVEHKRSIAQTLDERLSKEGFTVTTTHDGHEALGMLEHQGFDLIVVNPLITVHDTKTLVDELRENKDGIPVITTANLDQEKQVAAAEKLGVKDFIVESDIPLGKLIKLIQILLEETNQED